MRKIHTLKNTLFTFLIIYILYFFIRYPEESLAASTHGMKLWLNTLIPTLLPFIILTGILIKTDSIDKIFQKLHTLWEFLFGLSPQGTYAFFLGILCGYPMGAKITSDLYENNKISRREAHYLLTFANNASPAFIVNYLYLICFKKNTPLHQIIGILFFSMILCMIFFRFIVFRNHTFTSENTTKSITAKRLKKETSTASSFGTTIDVSIMNGFETITRLGGYILLFSIISAIIMHHDFLPEYIRLFLSGSAELTTGLYKLSVSDIPYHLKTTASISLTAFGGFCILAQTRSVLNKQLSIMPYLCAKLLNAIICILLLTCNTFY